MTAMRADEDNSIVVRLERWLDDAGLALAVEEDPADGRIVLSGIVATEEERQAAHDIALEIIGDHAELEDGITVSGALAAQTELGTLSEVDIAGFEGATADLEELDSL